jgi:transposase
MAYSIDLRKRVMGYLAEGHSQAEASEIFKVSKTAIKAWKKLLAESGGLAKKISERGKRKFTSERLRVFMEANPQAYLREIAEHFGGSVSGAAYALAREGITLKKR